MKYDIKNVNLNELTRYIITNTKGDVKKCIKDVTDTVNDIGAFETGEEIYDIEIQGVKFELVHNVTVDEINNKTCTEEKFSCKRL